MAPHSEIDEALSAELKKWLAESFNALGIDTTDKSIDIKPLSGDASSRRYFSLPDFADYLAVYSPTDGQNNNQAFIDIAKYLRQQSVDAPRVYTADLDSGFMLIENLGDRLLLAELNTDSVDLLYGESLMTLLSMQQAPRSLDSLQDYSKEKLLQEMELMPEWFVDKLLGVDISSHQRSELQNLFDYLAEAVLQQPQCFVHRDYHSRNLICRDVGAPGVIDFQDAVWGPITYDLASLLKDCYVRWPRERVENWALTYAAMAADVGVMPSVDAATFLRWFDLMGLQRHLKVLGIFARLFLRDGKATYLQDLPLVIRYTLEVADRYKKEIPQLVALQQLFESDLLKAIEKQSWYSDYQSAGYTP